MKKGAAAPTLQCMSHSPDLVARSHFTTAALCAKDAFDAWEDSISIIFDVTPDENTLERPFEAEVESFMIGGMMAAQCRSRVQLFERSNQTIARDGMDHLLLQFYVKGGNNIKCGDGFIHTQPGDIQIIDMAQELTTNTHDGSGSLVSAEYQNISLFIARDRIEELVPSVQSLHLSILRAGTPLNLILRGYIMNMFESAPNLSNTQADALVQPTVELLAATLGKMADTVEIARESLDNAALITIRKFIDRNLNNPKLTPELIAKHIGISRASLYRLCAPLGGIMDLVRSRRLFQARRLLSASSNQTSVKSIAYSLGFSNPSSFARAYKDQFGFSPSDTRLMFVNALNERSQTNASLPIGDRKYEFWMANLVA